MLRCIRCGTETPDTSYACPACRGALDIHPAPAARLTREDYQGHDRSVWRFARVLPVPKEKAVSFGEGGTPLVHVPGLKARLKCEYLNPTGSFKDRGTTVMVSKAIELGATHLAEDSSGNAGTSVAAYAARAGVPATIFVPEFALEAKMRAMQALGAEVRKIPGPRPGVTEATFRFAEEEGAYYASHGLTPWFIEGTKTLAFELLEDLDFQAPESIVTPASVGTVLLGLRRGFRELKDAGLIDREPRLFAVNAAGVTPLVDAVHPDREPDAERNTFADGVQVPDPVRLDQLAEAVKGTGGDAVAITEEETRAALEDAHRRGFLIEPTSAIALAGLRRFREDGLIREDEEPVVVLSGRFK